MADWDMGWPGIYRLIGRLWRSPTQRLQRQLDQNFEITQEVWTTPTVAEQFGLLPSSVRSDWRSGDADATD